MIEVMLLKFKITHFYSHYEFSLKMILAILTMYLCLRFEVFTEVRIHIDFWVMVPCSLVNW
jgi:hypothetical protein